MAAAQQRQDRLVYTSHTIACLLQDWTLQPGLLDQISWPLVDVNLTLSDGHCLHTALLMRLRADESEMSSSTRQKIVEKLLEYTPRSQYYFQSRDAVELLQWMAIGLVHARRITLLPFIQLLLETLHELGFDFNRRDAAGRALLTTYARFKHSTAIDVMRQLMRLGASASTPGCDGRTALQIWIEQKRVDLVESLLVGKSGPFASIKQSVDIWQQDADGRTLLDCMQHVERRDRFAPCITVVRELQRHWAECERPLVQRMLTLETPLIGDLAAIVIDFIDGGAGAKAK